MATVIARCPANAVIWRGKCRGWAAGIRARSRPIVERQIKDLLGIPGAGDELLKVKYDFFQPDIVDY
jgi:hypothetical protein